MEGNFTECVELDFGTKSFYFTFDVLEPLFRICFLCVRRWWIDRKDYPLFGSKIFLLRRLGRRLFAPANPLPIPLIIINDLLVLLIYP